jgi:hypothetical protein
MSNHNLFYHGADGTVERATLRWEPAPLGLGHVIKPRRSPHLDTTLPPG